MTAKKKKKKKPKLTKAYIQEVLWKQFIVGVTEALAQYDDADNDNSAGYEDYACEFNLNKINTHLLLASNDMGDPDLVGHLYKDTKMNIGIHVLLKDLVKAGLVPTEATPVLTLSTPLTRRDLKTLTEEVPRSCLSKQTKAAVLKALAKAQR